MSKVSERTQDWLARHAARIGRTLWVALAMPFWLGSTLPPPTPPMRNEPSLAASGRAPQILRHLDGLRETIWRQRRAILVFRALWLALLTIDVWLGLRVLAGRELSVRPFFGVAILVLTLAALLIATARPSRGLMARTLDRSFGLRERIVTALEESQSGRPAGVRALQIVEATRVAHQVSTARAFRPQLPVREIGATIVTGTGCAILLLLLLLQHFGTPGAGTTTATREGYSEAGSSTQADTQPGNEPGSSPGQNGQPRQNSQQGAEQQSQQRESGSTGANSGSSGAGQLPGGQQQTPNASPTSLLGADGKPIVLPKGDPNRQQITTQNPTVSGNGQGDQSAAGASGGSVQQGIVGEAGVDTNQVPFDQRGAVERYFTPSGNEGR